MLKKFFLLTAAVLALAGCSSTPAVEISNTWVKSSDMSMVGGMTAVFGTITNNSNQDITLVGASTDVANVVEIHEMAMSGGEMVMQQKEGGLVIPAGETAVLEPGGNHVMLMDLASDVVAGDTISVTFDLEGADDVTIEGIVAKPSEGGDEEYHSDEEMDMDH
jgi:copper(I)-binding protein